jgi:CelD/BcsL family acetyltransferase involved in cellulose biosynthesis
VRADVIWDPADVVRSCRLRAWRFQQIPAEQRAFLPYATDCHDAVYMDLAGGFEAYAHRRRQAGSQKLKELKRTRRRTERHFGPVRFELQTLDASTLESLMAWKSAQYRRAGATDVLSFPWANQLLRQSLTWTSPGFSSLLSALYIGDHLAAVELGLKSHEVLHAWFAAYNRDFAGSSPGILLIGELARAAPGLGIERVELGRNNLPYKSWFATASYSQAAGHVAVRASAKVLLASQQSLVRWSRSPWLAGPARMAKKAVHPLRTWLAFR